MPEFLDFDNLQPQDYPKIRFAGDQGPPFIQYVRLTLRLNPQISGPVYRPTRFEREEVI